jgi:4-oxalomesaconate hydratase
MKLLVFSAHCADFCSRSGGAIAQNNANGGSTHIVALTHGERSESGALHGAGQDHSLAEIAAIRSAEAHEAATVLGATIQLLGWDDLGFDYTISAARELAEIVRQVRPEAILTHHGPDPISVDHDTTWRLVTRAAQIACAPGLESSLEPTRRRPIYLFEATVPLTELEGFSPDLYVDVTSVWETKIKALQCFGRGQPFLPDWYTDVAMRRAFQARAISGNQEILYAEAFRRTTPWVGPALPE